MSLLVIIAALWGLCKMLDAARNGAKERQRQREIARVKAEQTRRAAEAARIREEWRRQQDEIKRQQAEAKEQMRRQMELEREQARQRMEQARLAREQERQAQEQARQAELLAKHEARIAELEFRMSQAEADIEAESERIAALYALMDIAAAEQAAAVPGSKVDVKAQKQIISYQSAIRAAEKRKAKAEYSKQTAQQKLSA